MIREGLFKQFKDEIPYSCEVRIDSFKDKSEDLSVIEATILVSRDSQKAIVIGKGGEALKALGVAARARLEEFLGRRVFLQLYVKTDKDWRSSAEALVKYGYVANDNYG
jgi:GTP-binding protein Era